MTFFGKKHITTKKLREGVGFFLLGFTGLSVGVIFAHSLNIMDAAIPLSVLASIYGVLTILATMGLLHRLNLETQCKIAGVNFEDYCTCTYHRKLKEKEEKGQSKL